MTIVSGIVPVAEVKTLLIPLVLQTWSVCVHVCACAQPALAFVVW